jgi:hypothetical protein
MGSPSLIACRFRSKLAGQEGIALLLVLVVITILAALVVSFTDTTQKHLQVTQYSKNRLQAYWAAQSGIQAAVALLRGASLGQQQVLGAATAGADGATSPWHYESDAYQQFVPLLLANIFCESSMLEPALLLTETGSSAADMGLSRIPSAAPILDENRKLSLFTLIGSLGTLQEATNQAAFQHLAYLLQDLLLESDFAKADDRQDAGTPLEQETKIGIDQAMVLAGYLVDWMDSENNKSPPEYNADAAEQGCPADELPYEAKNGLLDSIDEIGLVCGFRQLPRPVIERLARHLTAYNLTTNINTATLPVLHALCAAKLGNPGETDSGNIYRILHFDADEETLQIIGSSQDYTNLLGPEVSGPELITHLQENTGFASSIFRVGIYGLVFNTETGTELARSRIQMDLARRTGDVQFDVLYYRED